MNLPLNESVLQTRKKLHFNQSYMYVCRAKIKMHHGKGVTQDDHNVVLIEESNSQLRGECFRKILRQINLNDNLRVLLTGSHEKVNLSQVIDMGGYGIITTSRPSTGHFVFLRYHPRIDGKIQAVGMMLGQCGLGIVTAITAA